MNTIADVGAKFDLNAEVEHFQNLRDEDETHKMEMKNDQYDGLIDGESQSLESSVRDIFKMLVDRKDLIEPHEDRFLPGVLTE